MKYKVEDSYLDEAIRIRERYFECANEIKDKEDFIKEYEKKVKRIVSGINSDMEVEEIHERLIEIEKNINHVSNVIYPLKNEMNELENRADKLYEMIKEKYPDIDIDDVKKQIIAKL